MYLRVGSDHLAGVAAFFRAAELLFVPAAYAESRSSTSSAQCSRSTRA
jgi:hypothetical protein